MRIWGPGINAQFKGSQWDKLICINKLPISQKKLFCHLHQTDKPNFNQNRTKVPKWSSHIPGVLDNHDLTERVQHALNIENNIQKQQSEGEWGVKECLWTVSVYVGRGDRCRFSVCDLLSRGESLSGALQRWIEFVLQCLVNCVERAFR